MLEKKVISAVIITKNEERNLADCLNGLTFCDEIIVVDDYSNDKTVEIAKIFGARVYKRVLNNDFAAQKNFGLAKALGQWVFFVDADERVGENLRNEIIQNVNNPLLGAGGFAVTRKDILWGKELKHGENGTLSFIRLAKKGAGGWIRAVHEYWAINGEIMKLKNPLIHYPHPNLRAFLSSVNKYSSIHALQNDKEGKRAYFFIIILMPFAKFVKNYFWHLGFLDGVHGFVVAVMMSGHSFLGWSKLWLKQKTKT